MIEPNEGIYLFPTGDSTQTTAQLTMKSQGNYAYSGIAWSSSDEDVAVVEPVDGTEGKEALVTAKGTGVAMITVTMGLAYAAGCVQ